MHRKLPASVLVVLFAALAFAAPALGRPVAQAERTPPGQVVRYWTAERMKDAQPAVLGARENAGATNGAKSGGTTSVASTEVPQPYPSAYGKVFFTDNKGVDYVCSGTALTSADKSLVWTAGHCVNEGPGAFYKNFLFVPAYRDGAAPYGKFAASTLMTTSGWQETGEFGVDLGAAVVGDNSSGQTLDEAVVESPIVFNSPRNQSYRLYGYPAAKKFNGQRLRVCQTSWLMNDAATPETMGASCDMTGGSSGGAWVTSSGAVASVVSYGYSNLRNVLFGPHLETEAQSLYETAQAR